MNTVKDKVVEAAHISAEKTQEMLNDYVIPTAQAGAQKTQEVYNEYVVPTAQAGKNCARYIGMKEHFDCFFRCWNRQSLYFCHKRTISHLLCRCLGESSRSNRCPEGKSHWSSQSGLRICWSWQRIFSSWGWSGQRIRHVRFRWNAFHIDANDIFFFREYADEALKQGKVFKEVAKDKFDQVATETIKSKYSPNTGRENNATACSTT